MQDDLPPFNPQSACEKCGAVGALAQYVPAAYENQHWMTYEERAHVRRTCKCGHRWNESYALERVPLAEVRRMIEGETRCSLSSLKMKKRR